MLHNMLRKTINLTGSTPDQVAPFLRERSRERRLLRDLVDEDITSDSDVLRALVLLGVRLVRERQLDEGYAALAATEDAERESWLDDAMSSVVERIERDDG